MKQLILLTSILTLLCCKEPIKQVPPPGKSTSVIVLDSAYVASKTKYFTIENYEIQGDAKEAIHQLVAESQFIVLGESHGSNETSKLTTALIPLAKKAGFNNFAVEVGPHSAKKLMELSKPAANTIQSLHNFNTKYYFPELDDTSIPFFHGIEDARFMQAAAENEMELWGLDQEYFTSIIHQSDDLLSLAKNKPNFETIQKMKQEADKVMREWFIKDDVSERGIDLFVKMQEEKSVINFFNQFDESDQLAQEMIKDLKISWDIYTRWRQGSHDDRISYMRTNFMKNYKSKIQAGKTPKVLLKFGALHTPKTISGRCYDVGNLAHELAIKNGTICSNISLLNRYHTFNGPTKDNLQGALYYKRLRSFVAQGKMDQWTFIDLKAIKADLENGKITLPETGDYHSIRKFLDGFDYQIILPLDKSVEPNYTS